MEEGKKLIIKSGYYFIKRMAIPTDGGGKWYINNEGSAYSINKVSKYGRRVHAELSQETIIEIKN